MWWLKPGGLLLLGILYTRFAPNHPSKLAPSSYSQWTKNMEPEAMMGLPRLESLDVRRWKFWRMFHPWVFLPANPASMMIPVDLHVFIRGLGKMTVSRLAWGGRDKTTNVWFLGNPHFLRIKWMMLKWYGKILTLRDAIVTNNGLGWASWTFQHVSCYPGGDKPASCRGGGMTKI